MANPLAKTLIAIVAAAVAASPMAAQDTGFDEAVRALRLNKPAEALQLLQDYVASNPGNEEALELFARVDADVWRMLAQESGEFEKIAQYLLAKANSGRVEVSRDADKIAALVVTATTAKDFGERFGAAAKLQSEHAEFAVPELLKVLADPDADAAQNLALLALKQIGTPATMPLIAALSTSDDLQRRNVAAALSHIGDTRAAGALARAASEDSSESVREIATFALGKMGVTPGTSAVDLYTRDAQQYLTGVGLRGFDLSPVVWTWGENGLQPHDVPAELYHLELAKKAAHEAMRIDPANDDAQSLLARSYLAQTAVIRESLAADPENEAMQALAGRVEQLKMVAMTLGTDTLRSALEASLADNMNPVAIAAIEALSAAESPETLASSSALLGALDSQDSRVAYAAALAVADVADGGALPMASKVVAVLGQAVNEKGRRLVKLVGGGAVAMQIASEASGARGQVVEAGFSENGKDAIADIYNFPNYDVIVVDENLPDSLPRDVIAVIRKRAPSAKILLHSMREDAEETVTEAYGDLIDGVLIGELNAEGLIAKASEVADTIDPRRTKANEIAVEASKALSGLAGKVDVTSALENLAGQLNRSDDVAIPAAAAIGAGGTVAQLAGLAAVVGDADASNELRVACAKAAGAILSRAGSVPTDAFDAMLGIAADSGADLSLRSAVVTALGKGSLAPGERLKLADTLGVIAETIEEM